MHKEAGILAPDLTFYLDVSREISAGRMAERGDSPEKYESDPAFSQRLVDQYRILVEMSRSDPAVAEIIGKVHLIDGERGPDEISSDIRSLFDSAYEGR